MLEKVLITARATNVVRVLSRLASLITRNQLKVLEMKVLVSHSESTPNLMLTVATSERGMARLLKQLKKFVDLYDVSLQRNEKKSCFEDALCLQNTTC